MKNKKSTTQDKMIRKIDKQVWMKFIMISMENEISTADTVKLLVLFYEKQKELFDNTGQ